MKHYDKLVVSGCSFSAGNSDIKTGTMYPNTWSHFLLPKINPRIFVNVSIPGGGNLAASHNIVYLLETKKFFASNDTLVVFNITGLDRIDTMCYSDHQHANQNFSWNKDFGFGWITQGGFASTIAPFNGVLQKNIGLDQIITASSLAIVNTITYLESNKFPYAFMTMDDTVVKDSPEFLTSFLNNRLDQQVTFDGISNMHTYCKQKAWLNNDQFHPSLDGHRAIADFVYQHIDKY